MWQNNLLGAIHIWRHTPKGGGFAILWHIMTEGGGGVKQIMTYDYDMLWGGWKQRHYDFLYNILPVM